MILNNRLKTMLKPISLVHYGNFSESDPGMVFVEMASYVGDNLSFYLDTQFQEKLLYTLRRKKI
jgi:hypothetical protein